MNLEGKVVVITGAASGLGRTLSEIFSKSGAKVVLSDVNEEPLSEVAKEVRGLAIIADVTKEEDVTRLTAEALKQFGRIDIWINNAGLWTPHTLVEDLDLSRVRRMVEVNLFGTIHGSKAALIQMKKQGSGTIVNILSTSALTGRPGSSGYCASKYGATGFTKSLALEVNNTPLKVIAIYPGGMQTHLFDEKKPDDIDAYMKPELVAEKIIENLKKENPEEELILKRESLS